MHPLATALKRTFKIDVLKCDNFGGRMKLVAVVFDPLTIATTLRALGLPVRAPPIAPARSRSLLDSSHLSRNWKGRCGLRLARLKTGSFSSSKKKQTRLVSSATSFFNLAFSFSSSLSLRDSVNVVPANLYFQP